MTPLERHIRTRLRLDGPITVADYIALCLDHPEHGYYTTRDPFGAGGDFITAPEISQMFGELIGLSLARAWLDQGGGPFALAELGPGRGTLMADALRATKAVPGFHAALSLHLVELSPHLRKIQADALSPHAPVFHDDVSTLPEGRLFLIANEFFDALPVRQFIRQTDGWSERMVTLRDDRLAFALTEPRAIPDLDPRLADTEPGMMVEFPVGGPAVVGHVAGIIARHGGGALIIDYGDMPSRGDTLQALYEQAPDDPLAHPGQADLTAHVDFAPLIAAAEAAGASATGPVPQGVFLETLGITPRAQALARQMTGEPLDRHIAAHRRLTHTGEMGHLFKVMGLTRRQAPPLPGLAP
ncbi:class I SAM-dependent methyltransferase [Aestuariibius sp. 2305UL40-4]|uniref:class I SAM-dependent methyltransferase n=1 Tax=Aestuariibius violaceus TaxID=3234132 RepID=UPI00345EB421